MDHPSIMKKYLQLALLVVLVVSIGLNLYLATSLGNVKTETQYVTSQTTVTVTTEITYTKTTNVRETVYPLRIIDFMNREVIITDKPRRIISCAPSNTEILGSLGLISYIVGVDEFSDYPLEVKKLRDEGSIVNIGGVVTLNVEKIVELKPDIVFISANLQGKLVPILEEKGLTVVALEANNILDVYRGIILIGKIMNIEEEALKVVNNIRDKIDSIQLKLANVQSKKSIIGVIWLEPIWASGSNTFLNDIISLAGGYNSLIDSNGWIMSSPETIVVRNPEVILVTAMSIGLKPDEVLEKIKNIQGMSSVDAVKNDNIYLLYGQAENIFLRPGPRIGEAVELLAKILYPEVFKVKIPNVIGDDYREYLSVG
ncbi:MAG: ABC transporter substrate-binding protein [Aigarchaeota archaeon]|nr:ABC transporter substrate-binding protein [Aigarchaeota archaeon]MCX8192988.1 ABC transporter substrate-binding protein [Nitrososphaeria archaeon]MDW7986276.1 ABC transporter substrate-binding protein [Nitrososphaerota archaeon]